MAPHERQANGRITLNKGATIVAGSVAALLVYLGTIIGQFAPSNDEFAALREKVAIIEATRFTAADRKVLLEVLSESKHQGKQMLIIEGRLASIERRVFNASP